MAKVRITKRAVDAAKSGDRPVLLWDEEIAGFGLKVTPAGSKVYVYQYRLAQPGEARSTSPRRYTIGKHGDWTPDEARDRAKKLRALVDQGVDPVDQKRDNISAASEAKRAAEKKARLESECLFETVAENWLAHLLVVGKSDGYCMTSRWAVRTYLIPKLGGMPLPQIQPQDVHAAITAVSPEKRHARLAVSDTAFAIFKWAKGTSGGRLVTRNVVEDVDRPAKPKARNRVLSDEELALIWTASGQLDGPWPSLYRLIMLTGKRRAEISKMDWSELDRSAREWVIPGSRTKNGNTDLVPLSDAVAAELDALAGAANERAGKPDVAEWPAVGPVLTANGAQPIGNFSKVKRKLDEAIAEANDGEELSNWTQRDMRRTMATGLQRLGIRFEVNEAMLAHTGRAKSGVAAIYQRHDWKDEKREALEKWAAHVAQVVAASKSANVIPLEGRRA